MNILVISSNLIGDNILSTGIIKYFSEKHPNSKLTIVVGPSAAPLYDNFPNIEKVIIVKKQQFNFHSLHFVTVHILKCGSISRSERDMNVRWGGISSEKRNE